MNLHSTAYSSLAVETPENISLEYELAGPGTRMAAYFLDLMILSTVLAVISWFIFKLGEYNAPFIQRNMETILLTFTSIVYAFGGYFILFEFLMNGQTPGKKIMGIRTRMQDGTPVTLTGTLSRNFFRFSDCSFPFQYAAGCLCLVFTRNTQRPGDLVAGTVVVKESKVRAEVKFRWRPFAGRQGHSSHILLSREEFDHFMEYVSIHTGLSPAMRSRISQKLILPVLQNHPEHADPEMQELLKQMEALPADKKYQKAEIIMRNILRFYLAN